MPPDSRYDPLLHGPRRVVTEGFHAQVWELVATVPAGSLTTFGDVAAGLGLRSVARQVGWALAALPDGSDVPWFRVVTASGKLSVRGDGRPSREQVRLLGIDGVEVDERGKVVGFRERRHVFTE